MKGKRVLTLMGSVCVVLVLVALPFMAACAKPAPTPAPEVIELGYSTYHARGVCLEIGADKFKELVEERSEGRIHVTRYPASELYRPKALMDALAAGDIEMGWLHCGVVGSRSPVLEFISSFGAQGCWDDYDHYWRFLDNPEVFELAASEAESKFNCKLLAILSYGCGVVGANRPLRSVEDFKGLKMRTSGLCQATMYKALGAVPTELSAEEVYMALQRGTIDGATSGIMRFVKSKWYEVTPYILQDYTLPYLSFFHVIALDTWNKLSPEDQQIVWDTANEIAEWSRIYIYKETDMGYDLLRDLAKELYFFPASERAKLVKIVEPAMHELLIERVGPEMAEKLWGLREATRE